MQSAKQPRINKEEVPKMKACVSPYPLKYRPPYATPSSHNNQNTTPFFPAIAFPHQTLPNSISTPRPRRNRRLCTSDKRGYQDSLIDSDCDSDVYDAVETEIEEDDGIVISITKLGKGSRRIESSITINAGLETVWGILTDYEKLSDFIPGLAVSRLLDKRGGFARLFQIGQQNLALGFRFNAKAVLDCYEKDLETLSSSRRRDIEFMMVKGDFDTFEGKWSIEEYDTERIEANPHGNILEGKEFYTILSYVLEVKPKLWLPVRLVEGRICTEIKTNLSCVRKEAHIRVAASCS